MKDPIDRILSEDPGIEPSSGLADAVMRRVREEASEPPPIRFPWLRFALGMGTSVVLLLVCLALGWFGTAPVEPWPSEARLGLTVGLPAASLLFAFVAVRLSLRLV